MRKRKYCLGIVTLFVVTLVASGLSGCNAVKGFGHDISNVAQGSQNLINGDPVTYNQTVDGGQPVQRP